MKNAPCAIVAIGYNRPQALARLLASVGRADFSGYAEIPLIISIDQSPSADAVAAVAEDFDWPHGQKWIRRFDERQGLRSHVLQCGDLSQRYGAVTLLEDDLIVSPAFYQYVCTALDFYKDAPEICGISLYTHAWNGYADVQFIPQKNAFDTYLGQYSCTWGQCWTAAQWRLFRDWYARHAVAPPTLDGRIPADISRWPDTSWGKFFVSYIVENDRYYVMPYTALSTNCEEAGQHADGTSDAHQVMLLEAPIMDWRFAPVAQAIRYDIFFERMQLDTLPATGIPATEICVDLHDQKRSAFDCRYLLTTASYDLPVVCSFGMRMRPIEANVLYSIPGADIRLYDVDGRALSRTSDNANRRMAYELYRFDWRRLLPYSLGTVCKKLLGRVRRLFR